MDYFNYKKGVLHAEDVDVNVLAKKYKTPLYVYSRRTMTEHFKKIKNAFSDIDPLICYSVKANSALSVMNVLKKEGAGFDIVSGGELFRALEIGADPGKIVYAGVGKTKKEIEYAVKSKILMFNVESKNELKMINETGKRLKKKIDVALRVNPDVDALTHEYITTGKKENKFGIDLILAKSLFTAGKRYKHVNIIGVDMHIGSQITTFQPYVDAVSRVTKFIDDIRRQGVDIRYLNIGGGMGIIYDDEKPATADIFAKAVKPYISGADVKLILEPGRFIMGNAGILVSTVTYNKKGIKKNFLIADAGMNDLIRPSLYQAYHKIIPVNAKRGKLEYYDVVGPICESGDFLGKSRHLPAIEEGSLIAVRSAGAYASSMASNYNSRPRAAEVMVKGSRAVLIKERETYEDLIRREKKANI
ncbi:MAG: diaminopimelate decarboxylase [Candidatus Goldiibacteriota bacterium]